MRRQGDMTSTRPKLGLRIAKPQSDDEKAALIRQGLEHHLRLRWTYNRTLMQVAPQLLYLRNDSLHCDAIVIERDGVIVREQKLASFKLAGLKDPVLTSEPFSPAGEIDTADTRYEGGILARA